MIGFRGLGALALACAASVACSSSSGSGATPTHFACADGNPTMMASSEPNCVPCIQKNCNSQATAAFGSGYGSLDITGGACGSFLGCIASCACGDTACGTKCGTPSADCDSAEQAIGTCEDQSCASECGSTVTTGDDGGTVISTGDDGGTIGTGPTEACTMMSGGICIEGVPSSECTSSMGTAIASCPTAGLVGCCSGTIKSCYYAPQTASTAMQICSTTGGTFSTGM
jgi:hypothetical protein